jgi:hypothetical protein
MNAEATETNEKLISMSKSYLLEMLSVENVKN